MLDEHILRTGLCFLCITKDSTHRGSHLSDAFLGSDSGCNFALGRHCLVGAAVDVCWPDSWQIVSEAVWWGELVPVLVVGSPGLGSVIGYCHVTELHVPCILGILMFSCLNGLLFFPPFSLVALTKSARKRSAVEIDTLYRHHLLWPLWRRCFRLVSTCVLQLTRSWLHWPRHAILWWVWCMQKNRVGEKYSF